MRNHISELTVVAVLATVDRRWERWTCPIRWLLPCGVALLISVLIAADAHGDPIPGLFNTGVDDNGIPLHDNDIDPHYVLIEPSSIVGDAIVVTSEGGYPLDGSWWIDGSDVSAWISPSEDTMGPGRPDLVPNYIYRTTFNLTGMNYSRAQISGRWSADNVGLDILLNGVSTGIEHWEFRDWSPFILSVEQGHEFIAGENTLDFVMNNGGNRVNPTGLRVEMTSEAPPAYASFSQTATLIQLDIDLGAVPLNSVVPWLPFSITNLAKPGGLPLSLDNVQIEGDFHILATDVHSIAEISPGETIDFTARMNTTTVGDFASTGVFNFSDTEGAQPPLTLNLFGEVLAPLQAGDSNQDYVFDQQDLLPVFIANKYMSGHPATWGEGDWNGAPGGSPGNPPEGDGVFDNLDIVAALTTGNYLQGPYAAAVPEPSGLWLALLGVLVTFRWRRRATP